MRVDGEDVSAAGSESGDVEMWLGVLDFGHDGEIVIVLRLKHERLREATVVTAEAADLRK